MITVNAICTIVFAWGSTNIHVMFSSTTNPTKILWKLIKFCYIYEFRAMYRRIIKNIKKCSQKFGYVPFYYLKACLKGVIINDV